MKQNKILIISGPTASGKSKLAASLASKLDGVVINADSMQLYKELPILSAQPTKDEMFHVKHFLYSTLNYNDDSSVGIWLKLAKKIIDDHHRLGKLPIIAGGTGLYISKLIEGISPIPEIEDSVRKASRESYEEVGKEKFIAELVDLGDSREAVQDLDKQRVIRRFEVLKQTSKTLSWWQEQSKHKFYNENSFIHVNLEPKRSELYKNCDRRFEAMADRGGIEEVKELLKLNPADDLPITKTIGYFEIKDYLNGAITKEEMFQRACQKTRNYAKRQLTWFRNQFKNKIVFENSSTNIDEAIKEIENVSRETFVIRD